MNVGDYVKYVIGRGGKKCYGKVRHISKYNIVDIDNEENELGRIHSVHKFCCKKITKEVYDKNVNKSSCKGQLAFDFGDDYDREWAYESYLTEYQKSKKCECGAEKTYSNVTNLHHSYWCPMKEDL